MATKLVIVGGVAGGASAAARARRISEDAQIVLFERGDYVSFANCGLPYHIAGVIPRRERLLVQTPEGLHRRFRIDVRTGAEVLRLDPEAKTVRVRELATGREFDESYDKLILSPGAEPVKPPLPGIQRGGIYTLRTMADMDRILAAINKLQPEHAVVVGGGYIGLEMTEALRDRGMRVTLLEMANQVMNPLDPEMAAPLHEHLERKGVRLGLGIAVAGFGETRGKLEVRCRGGEPVAADLVILAIGVKPEVKLAREAGLKIGELGGITVDERLRTSDPNIYAVGDAIEVTDPVTDRPALIPLAGPANRQGRIAADNALGRDGRYRGTQGTSICKVFELAAGSTGANEKTLRRLGRPYRKVYLHPADHATYYPKAYPVSLKVLFRPEDGKLLGAQAVGVHGVDKRLDVFSTALHAGLTVYDLEELELCYAPPYGSAKDPVNYAGFIAANALRGDVELAYAEDVLSLKPGQAVLDVRTRAELEGGRIPGAVNIPVDELRDRLSELAQDKEWLVTCRVGQRGYIACRILRQHGFRCRNLTGGFLTYQSVTGQAQLVRGRPREAREDTGETS